MQFRQTSLLSSGSVSKNDFLTGKYVLPEKDFLEKAATTWIQRYLNVYH